MSARVRVTVAGVAHWHARRHIQEVLQADATIVGVSDRQPAMAARVAGDLGCPAYTDYRAMVEDCNPGFALAMG